jgi:O6-methylguanine-DNA--protein-cysteine methyltransferase
MTPSAYRAGGLGEAIAYAFCGTALGPLTMAAADHGVYFAQFGMERVRAHRSAQGEFPQANVAASLMTQSRELSAWIDALEARIAISAPRPDVPLDLSGTAFQIPVWKFLLGVPSGSVVSYGEVAQGIDALKAFRAAASACAANRIAVLIPPGVAWQWRSGWLSMGLRTKARAAGSRTDEICWHTIVLRQTVSRGENMNAASKRVAEDLSQSLGHRERVGRVLVDHKYRRLFSSSRSRRRPP